MKRLFLCAVLMGSAVAQQQDSITLDPAAMSEVWAQVTGGKQTPGVSPILQLNPAAAPTNSEWGALFQEARQAVNAATFPVLVLSLMQQLNPQLPMDKNVWAYAAALELHRLAFSGNARAQAELAAALRSGKLSGLNYFADEALAASLTPQVGMPSGASE
ncbi:MAG: hypothetical protein IJB89_01315 [Akkermansia sp.]|nr:hypothetical protein [Akkermansia sp.]